MEYVYTKSVTAAACFVPSEVHISRLPRLPFTVFDQTKNGADQSLSCDHFAYGNFARKRQHRIYPHHPPFKQTQLNTLLRSPLPYERGG